MERHVIGARIIDLTGRCEVRFFVQTVAEHKGARTFAGRNQ
jgi:hypothetical protein